MGHRRLGWDDYLAMGRRQRLVILFPLALGPALLYGLSRALPPRYESDALVLIQRQIIPNSLVPSAMTQDVNTRVIELEQQGLSRTHLEFLIKRYDLIKEKGAGHPMELLVEELRKDIVLAPVKSLVRSHEETLPGFQIAVTLSSARTAQQVCADLTSMFMEADAQPREPPVETATSFLEARLADAERKLDEQDAKLAAFKREHPHELPDDSQANINLLNSLNEQLQTASQALDRLQQDQTNAESLLAQQEAAGKATQAGGKHGARETLESRLAALQHELVSLQTQYTDDHPDVVKLKGEIAQVRKDLEEQSSMPDTKTEAEVQPPAANEPAPVQQLRSQVRADADAIVTQTKTQERLQAQIDLLQSRIQTSLTLEPAYKELTRAYQTAQAVYNDLLKQKNESGLATGREQGPPSERLIVMDPANLPGSPTFPNRPLFALGGLGAGLVVGLFIAWVLEMRDKSLRNEKDVEACLGLPTLAVVPSLIVLRKHKQIAAREAGKLGIAAGSVT